MDLEELARQSMSQFLPEATPPAAPPPAAPPQAIPPPAPAGATNLGGFDPSQNAVVKAPAGGLLDRIKEKLAPLGGMSLVLFEAFQLWQDHMQGKQIETEKSVNETQQSLLNTERKLNAAQQAQIEAQERLNAAQQTEINELKEKVRDLILVVDKLSARAGLYATPAAPPAGGSLFTPPPAAAPPQAPPSQGKGLFGP